MRAWGLALLLGLLGSTAVALEPGGTQPPAAAWTGLPPLLCVDPDWWPFEAINEQGEHVGIAADLIDLVTARIHLPLKLHITKTWEESVAASKAGICQVSSFLNQTPERDRWLIFTEPLLIDPNVLIIREDTEPFGDLASLQGRSIAIPKESSVYERVKKDFPNLKLIGTNSEYEAFGMVANRKADMTLRSRIVAGQNIKEKGWFNLRIADEVPGYENRLRMGVQKSMPELRDLLNQGIAALTRDERDKIINRHVELKAITDVCTNYTPIIWLSVVLVTVLATSWWWMRRLNRLNERLKQLSITDALTGLRNRAGLTESFPLDLQRAQRYARPLSIILLDLDHFKHVNDQFGHLMGDKVLIELAQVLQANIRQVDRAYRWGGEEFLVICPETPLDQTTQLAQRILESVRRHTFSTGKPMTASAGVATLTTKDTVSSLTHRADAALYMAKEMGRDQVCVAPDHDKPSTADVSFVQLVWHSNYECGSAIIDAQHRQLFAHANQLLGALLAQKPVSEVSNIIEALVHDVMQHFQDEEAILREVGFAALEQHSAAHQRLVVRAMELVERFRSDTLDLGELFQFLALDVIAGHILTTDREFFSHLSATLWLERLPT